MTGLMIVEADQIAFIAHTAADNRRANGLAYISHPRRAQLILNSLKEPLTREAGKAWHLDKQTWHDLEVAALLHDTIEDTGLSLCDLQSLGANERQLAIVDALTKPNPKVKSKHPDNALYYPKIALLPGAVIVKCADRCANLEDATLEVKNGYGIKRWRAYLADTSRDVLPLMRQSQVLYEALSVRIHLLGEALDKHPV